VPTDGTIDPDELIHVVTVPWSDIPRLVAPGPEQVQDAKTLIGLLLVTASHSDTVSE
jgi:hypothetical protein